MICPTYIIKGGAVSSCLSLAEENHFYPALTILEIVIGIDLDQQVIDGLMMAIR